MALDLPRLEQEILDALYAGVPVEDQPVQEVEDYAAALSAAIDKYIRDIIISVRVSGVESGSDTGRANVTVE